MMFDQIRLPAMWLHQISLPLSQKAPNPDPPTPAQHVSFSSFTACALKQAEACLDSVRVSVRHEIKTCASRILRSSSLRHHHVRNDAAQGVIWDETATRYGGSGRRRAAVLVQPGQNGGALVGAHSAQHRVTLDGLWRQTSNISMVQVRARTPTTLLEAHLASGHHLGEWTEHPVFGRV